MLLIKFIYMLKIHVKQNIIVLLKKHKNMVLNTIKFHFFFNITEYSNNM